MFGETRPAPPGMEASVLKVPLWRFALYALVILTGLAVALQTFLPRHLAQSWPTEPVSLGLDLRSGPSLTLRANEAAIRAGLASNFTAALAASEPAPNAQALEGGSGLITATPAGLTDDAAMTEARAVILEVRMRP